MQHRNDSQDFQKLRIYIKLIWSCKFLQKFKNNNLIDKELKKQYWGKIDES